jgi:hypothetical protein
MPRVLYCHDNNNVGGGSWKERYDDEDDEAPALQLDDLKDWNFTGTSTKTSIERNSALNRSALSVLTCLRPLLLLPSLFCQTRLLTLCHTCSHTHTQVQASQGLQRGLGVVGGGGEGEYEDKQGLFKGFSSPFVLINH